MSGHGTSDRQLARALRDLPGFAGVFASDELPTLSQLAPGGCLIANYSPSKDSGTHWVAFGNLKVKGQAPFYFDSYGFSPDDLDRTLRVKTRFSQYLQKMASYAGVPAEINNLNLQCHDSDLCGEYAVLACRLNSIPLDKDDRIRPQWRPFVSNKRTCKQAERVLRGKVKVRRR